MKCFLYQNSPLTVHTNEYLLLIYIVILYSIAYTELRCKEEGLFPELNGNCNYYFSCNLIKDHLEKRSLHCSSSRYFSPQTNMCEFCLLSKQMCCNSKSCQSSILQSWFFFFGGCLELFNSDNLFKFGFQSY